jgi:hypothetical protein
MARAKKLEAQKKQGAGGGRPGRDRPARAPRRARPVRPSAAPPAGGLPATGRPTDARIARAAPRRQPAQEQRGGQDPAGAEAAFCEQGPPGRRARPLQAPTAPFSPRARCARVAPPLPAPPPVRSLPLLRRAPTRPRRRRSARSACRPSSAPPPPPSSRSTPTTSTPSTAPWWVPALARPSPQPCPRPPLRAARRRRRAVAMVAAHRCAHPARPAAGLLPKPGGRDLLDRFQVIRGVSECLDTKVHWSEGESDRQGVCRMGAHAGCVRSRCSASSSWMGRDCFIGTHRAGSGSEVAVLTLTGGAHVRPAARLPSRPGWRAAAAAPRLSV